MNLNFWDLNFILYIIGFLLVPRLTLTLIFYYYVAHSFNWSLLFLPITIWWKFESLGLGFLSKLLFTGTLIFFPRLLLGVVGYIFLSPENHILMVIFAIVGVIIDIFMKFIRSVS